ASIDKGDIVVEFVKSFDPGAGEMEMSPHDLTRAILNLVSNSLYSAIKRKREIKDSAYKPTIMALTKDMGGSIEIAIRDNGQGIGPEIRDKVLILSLRPSLLAKERASASPLAMTSLSSSTRARSNLIPSPGSSRNFES